MRSNSTGEDARTWYEFVAAAKDSPAEILIYDYIGSFGVSAASYDRDLKALGKVKKALMRINSPGGDTTTAASIYNMTERWKAKYGVDLTVIVDGIAASAASWLAMLGDEVVMPENTLMMIHDPSGVVIGTSAEMKAMAGVLERIKQGMVSAYVKKSGKTPDEVASIMEDETWYSAQEAVDAGFADRVDNPIEIAAALEGFESYIERYRNPPGVQENGGTPVGVTSKEKVMTTNPNKQETPAEMEARVRAEVTAELATKAAAAPAPVPAPAAQETQAQMEDRVRGEITAKHAEITSLCAIAGKANRAPAFIAEGKTVAEVRVALETEAKAAPASTQPAPNTHTGAAEAKLDADTVKNLTSAPLDANAIYANMNKGKGTAVKYLQ